jgi:hypothetical protein
MRWQLNQERVLQMIEACEQGPQRSFATSCQTTGWGAMLKARGGGADDGFHVMDEEAVDQADAEDISEVTDEALETAVYNEALPAWTTICTGIQCPG